MVMSEVSILCMWCMCVQVSKKSKHPSVQTSRASLLAGRGRLDALAVDQAESTGATLDDARTGPARDGRNAGETCAVDGSLGVRATTASLNVGLGVDALPLSGGR